MSHGKPHASTEFYSPGIYYDPKYSSERLNQGVLVVGYVFEGQNQRTKNIGLSRTGIKSQKYLPLKKKRESFLESVLGHKSPNPWAHLWNPRSVNPTWREDRHIHEATTGRYCLELARVLRWFWYRCISKLNFLLILWHLAPRVSFFCFHLQSVKGLGTEFWAGLELEQEQERLLQILPESVLASGALHSVGCDCSWRVICGGFSLPPAGCSPHMCTDQSPWVPAPGLQDSSCVWVRQEQWKGLPSLSENKCENLLGSSHFPVPFPILVITPPK